VPVASAVSRKALDVTDLSELRKQRRERKNLGSRLQGHDLKFAPFDMRVKVSKGCTVQCR
jgi:hypothetical protein